MSVKSTKKSFRSRHNYLCNEHICLIFSHSMTSEGKSKDGFKDEKSVVNFQ